MSRQITIGIFFILLGAGFLGNLFLLCSGRVPCPGDPGELETILEAVSPLNRISRRWFGALTGETREAVRGRREVRFWRPELTALSRPPRLGAAREAVREFAAMFPASTRKAILMVPPKSRRMKEFLPFPLPMPRPGAALAAETGLPATTLDMEFQRLSEAGIPAFLTGDHHWSPEGMSAAVDKAAEMLGLERRGGEAESRRTVTARGDLGGMTGGAPESVGVFVPNPAEDAPGLPAVLICGDSFMNIYSRGDCGWGSGAGFPDLLASRYRCRVTCIAINGGGEGAARRQLAASGIDFSAYDCVLLEFPEYEVCRSDWLPTPLPTDYGSFRQTGGAVMTGTVLDVPEIPPAESASRLYANVLGEYIVSVDGGGEFLLLLPILRDSAMLPMPRAGARIVFRALDWADAAPVYGSMARWSSDDARSLRLPVIFGADAPISPPELRDAP